MQALMKEIEERAEKSSEYVIVLSPGTSNLPLVMP